MAEKWRDINGYDGVYQVSDLGQVRNTQTNKILQPTKLKNGRVYVTLSSDGFQKKCTSTTWSPGPSWATALRDTRSGTKTATTAATNCRTWNTSAGKRVRSSS